MAGGLVSVRGGSVCFVIACLCDRWWLLNSLLARMFCDWAHPFWPPDPNKVATTGCILLTRCLPLNTSAAIASHLIKHTMKTRNGFLTIVLAALLFAGLAPTSANAYVGVSVGIAPPAIPVYTQPYCPGPGYIWTPGYWAWDGYGYYWVPGSWVYPPTVGFLWTPGYWGWNNGLYAFNEGYWGPTVGFYGGINYGYGYGGHGYYGGRWVGNSFHYNTAVTRVNNTVITNAYTYKAPVKTSGSRAGFNGPGGAKARATAQEQAAAKGNHVQATSEQRALADRAKDNPDLKAKNNNGKPKAAAVAAVRGDNGEGANNGGANEPNAKAKQARAEKRAGAADQNTAGPSKQGRTEKAKTTNRTANTTEQSKAKAHRTAEATSHARKTTQPAHRTATQHATSAPRTVKHQPTVVRHPQPQQMKSRQASAGPSQQQQNAKKKKKEKPKG